MGHVALLGDDLQTGHCLSVADNVFDERGPVLFHLRKGRSAAQNLHALWVELLNRHFEQPQPLGIY